MKCSISSQQKSKLLVNIKQSTSQLAEKAERSTELPRGDKIFDLEGALSYYRMKKFRPGCIK